MADTYSGVCAGGPLDGQTVVVRSVAGFIAADKQQGRAWVYENRGGRFEVVTDHDASLIYPDGPITGERRIDWDRLPLSTDGLDVIAVGDGEEQHAGDPVDDGWEA